MKDKAKSSDPANRPKILTVLVTTNRGLCGAINSQVVREIINEPFITEEQIVVIGEKGPRAMANSLKLKKNVVFSIHPSAKFSLSFLEAGNIMERIKSTEFDELRIVYNRFENAFNMHVDTIRLPSMKTLMNDENSELLSPYEMGDKTATLENLIEFYYAGAINFAIFQNSAVETVSRRNAMDSASNNASEVGVKIRIEYNKTRQAEITTELSEIVSGAAAVTESK
jgi:ATP synthase F1 gamma subunit